MLTLLADSCFGFVSQSVSPAAAPTPATMNPAAEIGRNLLYLSMSDWRAGSKHSSVVHPESSRLECLLNSMSPVVVPTIKPAAPIPKLVHIAYRWVEFLVCGAAVTSRCVPVLFDVGVAELGRVSARLDVGVAALSCVPPLLDVGVVATGDVGVPITSGDVGAASGSNPNFKVACFPSASSTRWVTDFPLRVATTT